MTTAKTKKAQTNNANGDAVAAMQRAETFFKFPDPPEKTPDETATFDHLTATGNVRYLSIHLGNPGTTLVAGERFFALAPTRDMTGLRYPDLLVAFDVDPVAYKERNAYVISDQGKPPDFILEIASPSTGRIDTGAKRADYESLGVLEYWRFDETGRYHGTRLAGDRLQDDGSYEPISIGEIEDGVLEGYSAALNLNLRWEIGQLRWHDPETRQHIATFESERERADREWEARLREQARAEALEAELRQLRGQ